MLDSKVRCMALWYMCAIVFSILGCQFSVVLIGW